MAYRPNHYYSPHSRPVTQVGSPSNTLFRPNNNFTGIKNINNSHHFREYGSIIPQRQHYKEPQHQPQSPKNQRPLSCFNYKNSYNSSLNSPIPKPKQNPQP